MANSYFKFKQFTVFQDQCAMKVCTDACLFGASIDVNDAKNILDIGTGTGLLSLMIAQKTKAEITAIEIDKNAFEQAKENFKNSPWNDQIVPINTSIQLFAENTNQKFDLIISNPPFFQNHLKSAIQTKNAAKHDDQLRFEELTFCISKLLAENGRCYILLPEYQANEFEAIFKKYEIHKFSTSTIKQKVENKIFRIINGYTKETPVLTEIKSLAIQNSDNSYSPEFISLLKDYYLSF